MPVVYDAKVKVAEADGRVSVEGPAGKLELKLNPRITVEVDETSRLVTVVPATQEKGDRALQGLTRSLLQNLVTGVIEPYQKGLEIVGVGYTAQLSGNKLTLQVGFAYPRELQVPEGVEVEVPEPTRILVKSADKQKVGQFASMIRRVRPPEPYKGKGIRYSDEEVKRKPGKAFVGGEA